MSAQLNLLPRKKLGETALGKLLEFSLSYGRYIIVGTQLVVLLSFFSRFQLDRELTDLTESIEQKRAIVQSLQPFEKEVRDTQARLKAIARIKSNQDYVRGALTGVKKLIGPGNALTDISVGTETIRLRGTSRDEQALVRLMRSAGQIDEFGLVEFDNITKRSDTDEFDFSATVSLNSELSDNISENRPQKTGL